MQGITILNEHIKRIVTPYKDIYTSVFLIRHPSGAILFDAASYDEDIDERILPFLNQEGIKQEDLKYVFISHNHTDHAGGLERLMAFFPNAVILSDNPTLRDKMQGYKVVALQDGERIMKDFIAVRIPGHTLDSSALLDERTGTLLTGDCLQQYGIFGSQDWGSNIRYPAEHLQALKKLRGIAINEIITAHDYYVMGDRAIGAEAVEEMICDCEKPLAFLKSLIIENPSLSDAQIRMLYNTSDRIPPITVHVVAAMREALKNKTII